MSVMGHGRQVDEALLVNATSEYTAQKMNFSIKYFFSKYDQIRKKLWIWSHLLKKSLMEQFIFYAVVVFILKYRESDLRVCHIFRLQGVF